MAVRAGRFRVLCRRDPSSALLGESTESRNGQPSVRTATAPKENGGGQAALQIFRGQKSFLVNFDTCINPLGYCGSGALDDPVGTDKGSNNLLVGLDPIFSLQTRKFGREIPLAMLLLGLVVFLVLDS